MKRWFPAALFLSGALLLSACSDESSASGSLAPESTVEPAATPTTANPAPAAMQPTFAASPSLPKTSATAPTTVRPAGDAAETPTRLGNARPPRFDPAEFASSVQRDVTYCVADGVELKMDVYFPQTLSSGTETALLYVHGGGWAAGDKTAGEGIQDFAELLRRGYVIFAVNYRLAPEYEFPAMIEDVKCAVRSIRSNATTWDIDPDNIGAWGGSAGGHLVNMLGTTDADDGFEGDGGYAGVSSRVQAVVDYFGPADFTTSFTGGSATTLASVFGIDGGNNSPEAAAVSPVTYATSDDPPFAIYQGEEDILVWPDQSQRMYDALVAVGVETTLTMVANAGHGFVPSGGSLSPARAEITQSMANFFDAHLR